MAEKSKEYYQQFAFPVGDSKMAEKLIELGMNPFGMDKRFYAACAAMQGMLANSEITTTMPTGRIIADAYNFADELLKQENQEL